MIGITPRSHPDRAQVMQFLDEVRLLLAAASHHDHLLELVADYAELNRLEADQVVPAPRQVPLPTWLQGRVTAHRSTAASLGLELRLQHRSFLPSHDELDPQLAARALDAVLHVAMHRALPGPLDVRVSYRHGRTLAGPSRLGVHIATRGGGYTEVERGYVCAPFAVRDGASRPLLGLSIAQRLCTLLAGELRVDSPGLSTCRYVIELAAEPTPDARWVDPLAPHRRSLGPVRPGRVLFVGRNKDTRMLCSPALQHSGYVVEVVETEEQVLAAMLGEIRCWSAIVFDPTCANAASGGLVERLRGHGFVGKVLAVQGAFADAMASVAVDAVLHTPLRGDELLELLTVACGDPDG